MTRKIKNKIETKFFLMAAMLFSVANAYAQGNGMAEFNINKGIGRPAEFKGLKAQYLVLFAGGLLAVFVVTVVLYMLGIPQTVCVGFGAVTGTVLVRTVFHLNRKYGEHGLMKRQAVKNHPRYITSRRRIGRLFKQAIGKEERR